MHRILLVLSVLVALVPASPSRAATEVVVTPIEFSVTNPLEPGVERTVRGHIYRPADAAGCTGSVMLLLHGLSYGQWGWDFPIDPDTYSVARALARAGHPAVAIDELGYGTSAGDEDPNGESVNGYTLTVQSYAAMTSQIVGQLRASGFEHVGLMGHSAGTEISELTAGIYGGVDVLVATAYHHSPSQRIVTDFVTGDVVRAAQGDYEYFGDTEEQRAEYMYNLDVADPDVVALDTELANLTPSGEVWTISNQPSRWVLPAIDVPVLLVVAEEDILFPPAGDPVPGQDNVANELSLFVSSPDATAHVIPDAGHSFMLHPNAPETNAVVAAWLGDRLPSC